MLGQVIHGYRVDRALSEDKGGFGDVYFATHVESGAEAVVKVLKPEMSARRDIVARFFNEARAAASIHHPGIVQIHNVGYHGERAYLLMERLRGSDLESRLEAGPVPLDRAVLFMRQAAGAIGAAHERGIVHRDLKPANLFIVPDPDVVGGERVKVLDFGIAKLTTEGGAGKTQGVFGSPPYMSPEQCASAAAVDARSDLYSLGCIFYELVCGRPPFGHGGIELIASHLRDTPAPPRAISPWVPPAIEQVILGLLEKQPERRIPSCAALIATLDQAAAVSGLPAASASHLPVAGGFTGTAPQLGSATLPSGHPTTLGSAASASATPPAKKRGQGVWLGLVAIVVVGGGVTAVMALGGQPSGGPKPPPQNASDGGVAITVPPDAASVPMATPDAAAADEIAEQLNEEGKALLYNDQPEPAIKKFQEAAARVPLAKFFVNLCVAQIQAGRLNDALTSCMAVELADATDDQRGKATELIARIKAEAKKQNLDLHDATPPDRGKERREPPTSPRSMTQAEIASRLNEEGKALMYADKPDAAAKKFQEAVARVPEPAYFINLCTARLQSGRLDEALAACDQVEFSKPTERQRAMAAKLIGKIQEEAKKQGLELHRRGR